MKLTDEAQESILRPRMAKRLKVSSSDVFRWLFWKEFGRSTPSDSDIAQLKDRIMDADWPLIDKALAAGRPSWWTSLWFRLKCRLASTVDDLDAWIRNRNFDNLLNGVVDVGKNKKYARERLDVLKGRGGLLMYELKDAAQCCEVLGAQPGADMYYRKILDIKLKGTKWPERDLGR